MISFYGVVGIPKSVLDVAEPIKLLNYKITEPGKFKKQTLQGLSYELMIDRISEIVDVPEDKLDCVFFSACSGAKPHIDMLDPEVFTHRTFVVPVILPPGCATLRAGRAGMLIKVGGVYEINHERTHSLELEDTESGCVVIMISIKH